MTLDWWTMCPRPFSCHPVCPSFSHCVLFYTFGAQFRTMLERRSSIYEHVICLCLSSLPFSNFPSFCRPLFFAEFDSRRKDALTSSKCARKSRTCGSWFQSNNQLSKCFYTFKEICNSYESFLKYISTDFLAINKMTMKTWVVKNAHLFFQEQISFIFNILFVERALQIPKIFSLPWYIFKKSRKS